MSDELKQAADRLQEMRRRWSEGDVFAEQSVYRSDPESPQVHSKESDVYLVAVAYLEEHANDDESATLLTAEILRASGWRRHTDQQWYLGHATWCLENVRKGFASVVVYYPSMDIDSDRCVEIGDIETVVDLRMLLKALHIDAAVVVPKGVE